jgi:hypothetical protein
MQIKRALNMKIWLSNYIMDLCCQYTWNENRGKFTNHPILCVLYLLKSECYFPRERRCILDFAYSDTHDIILLQKIALGISNYT